MQCGGRSRLARVEHVYVSHVAGSQQEMLMKDGQ